MPAVYKDASRNYWAKFWTKLPAESWSRTEHMST